MLLSEFDINDYKREQGSYDDSYQCLVFSTYGMDTGYVFETCEMPIEAAFVKNDEIQLLRVNAKEFQENIQYLKDVLEDKTEEIRIEFSYEAGNSTSIDVVPVAWIEETNALYFENKS